MNLLPAKGETTRTIGAAGFDLTHVFDNINLDPGQIAGAVIGLAETALAGYTPLGAAITAGLGVWTDLNIKAHPGNWLEALADEGRVVAYLLGFNWSGVAMTALVQAIQGKVDSTALWDALKKDWDVAVSKYKAATDILLDGNYTAGWNLVTNNGELAVSYFGHWPQGEAPPQPQPNPNAMDGFVPFSITALAAKVQNRQIDPYEAADIAYKYAYYAQGDAWKAKARADLINSPAGALFATNAAKNSNDPVRIARVANDLRAAARSADVRAYWDQNGWKDPSGTLNAFADVLAALIPGVAASTRGRTMHPAAAIAIGAVAVAGAAAVGVGVWAAIAHLAYGEAWQRALGYVADQARTSGSLLVEVDPLKGAKLLGAAETAKKKRGTTKIQSVLIPRNRFTRAQADAWMRRPEQRARGLRVGKVDTTENYFRYRQFSPSKKTVVGTIAFGDSGIKALVAR